MLRLTLFGYPTVTLDSQPLNDFISQKALVLLCYLVLEPRPHARETLAGLFWAEMPQERALSNLRQALHNIQKLAPGYINVSRQTAEFDISRPYATDVAALDGDNPHNVLAIYRDSFMAGIVIEEAEALDQWINIRRESYRLRAASQLQRLLDISLNQHHWPQIAAVALRLISLEPYAESAHRALWRAHVRAGNIGAALAGYKELAGQLADELGSQPSPETERFAQRLTIAQETPRHNIPSAPTAFVGREKEITRAETWLMDASCRLVTLQGIGGVGKSRLAQKIGHNLAASYLNGALYAPLANVLSAAYLPSALASAFGMPLVGVTNLQQALHAFLAGREALVILDNAEHLPELADWIAGALDAAPDIKFLVTSRHRLELREEWILHIDGLPYKTADSPAASTSAVVLAQNAQRSGYIEPLDPTLAETLCALLEGVPLGIEMAGALLPDYPLSQLVDAVRANLDTLRQRWRNAEERHISLRAAFNTSWMLINPYEQKALAALSIFGGTFSADGAHHIADADMNLLQRLAAKSLIRQIDSHYTLHAVIRRYATEFRSDETIIRHKNYYLALLAQAEAIFERRDILGAVTLIQSEIDNVRQLWQTALEYRDLSVIARTMHTLHRFYEGAGGFTEGAAVFKHSIEMLNLVPSINAERILLGELQAHQAGLLLRTGGLTEAHTIASASVDHLQADEQPTTALAFALNTLGITQIYRGDTLTAQATLEQCAAIYRQLNRVERVKPLINLASLYTRTGDIQRARLFLEEARPLAASIDDQVGGYHITNGLGVACTLLQDYQSAISYYKEALQLSATTGYSQGRAVTLNNLGDIYTLMGDAASGITYASEAAAAAREIKDNRSLTYALTTLTLAQTALNLPEARATLTDCLQAALDTNADPLILTALYALGVWEQQQNRPEAARKLWAYIASHPASEMDYRQRSTKHLAGLSAPSAPELSPAALAQSALKTLSA